MATPVTAAQGQATKLAFKEGTGTQTWTTGANRMEFQSCTVSKSFEFVDTNGIRGTRSHLAATARQGIYTVGGTIELIPSPADLDVLLPWILGADVNTVPEPDEFDLAETLQAFAVLIDKVADVFQYTDCYVNRATFRGRTGELVTLSLDIIGQAEDTTIASFPTDVQAPLGAAANNAPYIFSDGALNLRGDLGGTEAFEMFDFECVIDNSLDARFANSQTATSITPQDRVITLRTTTPIDANTLTGLYDVAAIDTGGTIVLTNGGMSTTFTFGVLIFRTNPLEIPGKSEIPLVLEMQAMEDSIGTKELVVAHDSVA